MTSSDDISNLQRGLSHLDLARIITNFIAPTRAILFQGQPGIGKTDLAKELGRGGLVEVVDLNSHLPEDIAGYPKPDPENGHVTRLPEEWMTRLSAENIGDKPGVLVLDDLSQAGPSMQAAVFRVALERRVGGRYLGKKVRVIITANRRSDKAGAGTILSPLVTRCWTMQVECDLESWLAWSKGDQSAFAPTGVKRDLSGKDDHIIDSRIRGYLRFRGRNLAHLPGKADTMGRFPTPRTWHFLSESIKGINSRDLEDILYFLGAGFVGDGPAVEFCAFVKHYASIPDPETALRKPRSIGVIKDQDRLIAVLMAVVDHGIRTEADANVIMKAVAIISDKSADVGAMAIKHWVDSGYDEMAIANTLKIKEAQQLRSALGRALGVMAG